jgi:hypothetical protein
MRKLPVLEIKEKPAGLRLAAHKGLRGRETRSTRIWIECATRDQAELQRAHAVLSTVANQEQAQ